jgi:tetratricopeptide (TPR) repeat protein
MNRDDSAAGHASAVEADEIALLRRKAAAGLLHTQELMQLALKLFEPAHDPFTAVEVLKEVLARDPSCDVARVWLAYLNIYELMDDAALREALTLADEVNSEDKTVRAAALLLKGATLRHLGRAEMAIAALVESVRLADDWITNRQALSDMYRQAGRKGEAIEQLRAALKNFELAKNAPRAEEPREVDLFEIYLTGRAASNTVGETIRSQLRAASS